MQNNLKSIKLISELADFVFDAGAGEFVVNYKEEGQETKITIESNIKNLNPSYLETLEGLNTERQSEVEEYYWELVGESNTSQELTLVGMMIDKAEYSYENDLLKITVYRHK